MGLKRFMLFLLLACNKPAPAPKPPPQAEVKPDPVPPAVDVAAAQDLDEGPNDWTIHSGDGKATLHQKGTTPEHCVVSCSDAEKEVWKSNGACLADKTERKFMSKDCEKLVVMIPSPPRGKSWRQAVVMRVYKRDKL